MEIETPVFVLTTTGQPERMKRMNRRLERLGVAYGIFCSPGISDGILGCATSHLAVCEKARNCGFESLIVFEDDCILRDDAFERLAEALSELRDHKFLRLLLGACFHGPEATFRPLTEHTVSSRGTLHLHAYYLNRGGMEWLSHSLRLFIEAVRLDRTPVKHGDQWLASVTPGLDVNITPIVAVQENGYSQTDFKSVEDRLQHYFNKHSPGWSMEEFLAHLTDAEDRAFFPQKQSNFV